jgi:hypothetical protein
MAVRTRKRTLKASPTDASMTVAGIGTLDGAKVEQQEGTSRRKLSLAEFFLASPLRGSGMDLQRIKDEPRDIEL